MKSRIFHYLIYVTFLIGIPTDVMSLGYDTKENIDGIFYRLFSPKVANYYKEYEAYVTTPEEGNYSGDIMIPSTVTFDGDTYTVTKISSYAFCYDSEVTSITIPHTVNEIGTNAFLDCQGLSRLTIPESVTEFGSDPFGGCTLNPLIIKAKMSSYNDVFNRMNSNSVIYANSSEISKIQQYWSGAIYAIDDPYYISIIDTYDNGVKFRVSKNTYFEGDIPSYAVKLMVMNVATGVFEPYQAFSKDYSDEQHTDYETIGNLEPTSRYRIDLIYNSDGEQKVVSKEFMTDGAVFSWYLNGVNTYFRITSSTQRTCEIGTADGNSAIDVNTTGSFNVISDIISIPKGMITAFPDGAQFRLTGIGEYAFANCSNISAITIGINIHHIGKNAFIGCTNLTSISSRLTKPFVIDANSFANVSPDAILYVPVGTKSSYAVTQGWNSIKNIVEKRFSGEIFQANTIEGVSMTFYVIDDEGMTCAVGTPQGERAIHYETNGKVTIPAEADGFRVVAISKWAFVECINLTSLVLPETIESIGEYCFYCPKLEELILPDNVTNIGTEAFYTQSLSTLRLKVNSGTKTLITLWKTGYTPYDLKTQNKLPAPRLIVESVTQTTATIKIEGFYDKCRYYLSLTHTNCEEERVVIKELPPGSTQDCILYVYNEEGNADYKTEPVSFVLKPFILDVAVTETASSISAIGTHNADDVEITKREIAICSIEKGYGKDDNAFYYEYHPDELKGNRYWNFCFIENTDKVEGNNAKFTGLIPNTSCYLVYAISSNNDVYVKYKQIKTQPLTLTTLQPKVISAGNVIVAAQSNIDDEETNVGFEWRRTDWTDDFPSNTGSAFLYDGTMEGYIRNLNTEKLWKYRPYYTSSSGKTYYGEWMGLDPTNTSYFEPTVHTYAKIQVQGNSAEVKGYAMRGSDNIVEQGFKYWKQQANARGAAGNTVNIPKSAQTVEATGNMMTAELTGLDYESDYCVVAFMKTSENEIFYGEQQTFRTGEDITGIETLTQPAATDNTGIYDLKGHKLTKMQRGMNIIRMSDGTVRKVMVK